MLLSPRQARPPPSLHLQRPPTTSSCPPTATLPPAHRRAPASRRWVASRSSSSCPSTRPIRSPARAEAARPTSPPPDEEPPRRWARRVPTRTRGAPRYKLPGSLHGASRCSSPPLRRFVGHLAALWLVAHPPARERLRGALDCDADSRLHPLSSSFIPIDRLARARRAFPLRLARLADPRLVAAACLLVLPNRDQRRLAPTYTISSRLLPPPLGLAPSPSPPRSARRRPTDQTSLRLDARLIACRLARRVHKAGRTSSTTCRVLRA